MRGVFEDEEDDRPTCFHCGRHFDVTRKGRPPKYCPDHRTPSSRKPASSTNTVAKVKAEPSFGYGVAWAALGYGVQLRVPEPIGPPVGRVMQFQGPDAGPRLERLLGKLVDKMPFIKALGKETEMGRDIAALLGPPLLTAAFASGQLPAGVFEPLFAVIMRPIIAQAMEATKAQATTITEMSQADQEMLAAAGDLMRQLFTPTEEVPDGQHGYAGEPGQRYP